MRLLFYKVGALVLLSFFLQSFSINQIASTFNYRKIKNEAFKEGEKLTFRVHYGILNAARITMSVDNTTSTVGDRKVYKTTVEGQTYKTFDWAYKVRDKFESWIDLEAIAPLRYAKQVREDKYTDQDFAIYMHDKAKLKNVKGLLTIPSYTHDIASVLYYARNLDLQNAKVGANFPLDVYLDNKVYNLSFTVKGRETLKTDIGKIKCIKLQPKLVVDRVFKEADDMEVWVSDDENKIPIRVKSAIKVGSLKVDITDYANLKNDFKAKI